MDKKGISKKKSVSELTRLRKLVDTLMKAQSRHNRVERTLHEREQQYRILFEKSPISLWEEDASQLKLYLDNLRRKRIKDIRKYFEKHPEALVECASLVKVVHVNRATLKLYRAKSEKEFGSNLHRVFTRESYDVFREEIIALAQGKKTFEGEAVNQTVRGDKLIRVFLKLTVVPGYERSLARVIIAIIDITELKRIEEDLRKSEEQRRTFMDSATEGFVLFNSNMNIIDVNDYLIREFGFKKEDVIGLNMLDISLNPWEAGRYDQYMKVIETGQPYIIDDVMPPPKFGDKHFALKAFKVGDGMGMIIRDVTDQIRAENALRESEARFRSLYESVQAGVIVQEASGKIIHANKIACDILGISESRLKEKKFTDPFWHMADENGKRISDKEHPMIMTCRTGRLVRNAVRCIFPDDSTKRRCLIVSTEPILDPLTGKPEEVIVTFVDITERKKVEETLRESEMRYRHIFEQSPIGIGISSLDGKVITANKAMQNITGYTLKEFRKINIADTYMNKKDREALRKAIDQYSSVADYRVRLKRKDGTPYDALLNVSRINIGGKDYLHTICHDITGKKKPKRK